MDTIQNVAELEANLVKAQWLKELLKCENQGQYNLMMEKLEAAGLFYKYDAFLKTAPAYHRLYLAQRTTDVTQQCQAFIEYFLGTICTSDVAEAFPVELLRMEGESTYMRSWTNCKEANEGVLRIVKACKVCGGPDGRQGMGIKTFKTLLFTALEREIALDNQEDKIFDESNQVVENVYHAMRKLPPTKFNSFITELNYDIKQGVQDVYANLVCTGTFKKEDGSMNNEFRLVDTSCRGIPNLYLKRRYVRLFSSLYPDVVKCLTL